MPSRGLPIRDDLSASALRRLAVREADRGKARRMMAIANALEGMSRAEAARLAGMERQALRDAVVRYNAEGLAGLSARPRASRRPLLDAAQAAELGGVILGGPDPERDGLSTGTLPELCRVIEARWGKRVHPAPACHGSCGGWATRGRRPGLPIQAPTALRWRRSKRGARRRGGGDRRCAPRQACHALVRGRSPDRPERVRLPPLLDPRATPAGAVRPALCLLGAHLRRRPARHRRARTSPSCCRTSRPRR